MLIFCWVSFFFICGQAAKQCDLRAVNSKSGEINFKSFDKLFRGKGRRPVVFRNLTSRWPAMAEWSDSHSFIRRHGHLVVGLREQVVHGAFDKARQSVSIKEFLTNDSHRNTLQFDFGNLDVYRALLPDTRPMPDAFRRMNYAPAFTLGRNGTGSAGHTHEENWLAQVAGRKVWILASPEAAKPSETMQPCDLLVNRQDWPSGVLTCTVNPGEIIYLPNMWYHATCNLDEFTLAVGAKGTSKDWPDFFYDIQAADLEALKAAAAKVDITKGVHVTTSMGEEEVHRPLHFAVEAGSLDMVKFLLNERADPRAHSEMGMLANVAAGKNKLDILQYLINNGHFTVSSQDEHGWSPLHHALTANSEGPAKFLLAARASVNARADHDVQLSPLHIAAAANAKDLIKELIVHRAKIKVWDTHGRSPLHWAAAHNCVSALEALKEHGVDLSERDKQGNSILHSAADTANLDVIDFLLRSRMDINMNNRERQTPLNKAAAAGHLDTVQLLVERRSSLHFEQLEAGSESVADYLIGVMNAEQNDRQEL